MYAAIHLRRPAPRHLIFGLALTLAAAACCALLGTISTRAAPAQAAAMESVNLPIVMYHGLLRDGTMQGQYVVSPDALESDIKYLQEQGYTAVDMQDLINYVNKQGDLPEKPVMLTFDDGYYNNYLYGFPLAKKYNCKLVISPIGYYTEKFSETEDNHATYSHITWEQMKEMDDSGLVEFQNHSYNLHANAGRLGTRKLKSESDAAYAALLTDDLQKMQDIMKAHLGKEPTTFVYPFGAISQAAPGLVKGMGFQATLTCESRVNRITRDPECLYGLGRWLRPAGKDSASFFQGIFKKAK